MINHEEYQYLDLMRKIQMSGVTREGRNGLTRGLFGAQMRFDLQRGFPLLTTKWVYFHAIVVELLWFLRGEGNIDFLHEHNVHIWDKNADADGNLGPVYGVQWRKWPILRAQPDGTYTEDTIDQIARVIEGIKADPYGRRHIVSAWNVGEVPEMRLPPCHMSFQFSVANGALSCHMYQRSADWFLGVPFNIASYALLTHLIARETGLGVGDLIISFGDLHLYDIHMAQVELQLSREPNPFPTLYINDTAAGLFDLKPSDIRVVGYDHHPGIKAEMVE